MTRADFEALSDEEAFKLCCPGIVNDVEDKDDEEFDLNNAPYQLSFKKASKYTYGVDKYSKITKSKASIVPYDAETTVQDCIDVNDIKNNNTLFADSAYLRGKEFGLCLTFHKDIDLELFTFMANSNPMKKVEATSNGKVDMADQPSTRSQKRKSAIDLYDCFDEFKTTETLDENNMWYCSKCKDHVCAEKTLEINRVPRLLVISLKRFKTTQRRMGYGFGGMGGFGGGKIDGVVDFPLEGLDMTRYVGSEDQKMGTELIYDCYAVSNHMGGTGGGHYTAYAKHPISGKWNSYNDSSVHEVGRDPEDVVVSDSLTTYSTAGATRRLMLATPTST